MPIFKNNFDSFDTNQNILSTFQSQLHIMKINHLFLFAIVVFSLSFVSCNSGDKSVRDAARSALEVSDVVADPALSTVPPSPTTTPEPPQNAAGVWHYTCVNGCAGGAGAAGKCASCGGDLTHNTAYHDTPAGAGAGASPLTSITPPIANTTTSPITTTTTTTTQTEPAQNAAGVWHYTCPNGCAGGAGDTAKCPGCGTMYTHNSAYHN